MMDWRRSSPCKYPRRARSSAASRSRLADSPLLEDQQRFLANGLQIAPQRGQGLFPEANADSVGGFGQSPNPRRVRGAALPQQPVDHVGETQQIESLRERAGATVTALGLVVTRDEVGKGAGMFHDKSTCAPSIAWSN